MLVQMESSLVGFHSKGCRMVFCMLWHKFVDQNRWKVDGKNCENYSDLIFAWGSPIWQTNTWNRWCLCVVPFFIGKSHVPPGSRFPPPAVFSRRAKRPWNPSSLRIITPGTSGSFGGVEAVDSDGVQLRRCGYKFDKRNSGMMEIEDIEKWWNDEFFFPGAWGSICVLWSFPNNKSPTESPSFGKDTKMLQPTNHVEHNSSLDNFTSWEAEGLHIQFAHLCLPRWLKF